jgi:hypothetical protein
LLERLRTLGGFERVIEESEAKSSKRDPADVVIATVRTLNGVAKELTQHNADLKTIVPGALAAAAAVSFVMNDKNSRMPSWDSLLWWSYSMFLDWHSDLIASGAEKTAQK